MINLFILAFFFLSGPQSSIHQTDLKVKWYIKTDKTDPNNFTVTIDTREVNRYIQLSDIRFVADFKNVKDDLISRDTISFFPNTSGIKHLAGNHISSMTYKQSYGPGAKITGIKLFYTWDDSSISLEPDPIEERVIIKDFIYGEGSADVSDSP